MKLHTTYVSVHEHTRKCHPTEPQCDVPPGTTGTEDTHSRTLSQRAPLRAHVFFSASCAYEPLSQPPLLHARRRITGHLAAAPPKWLCYGPCCVWVSSRLLLGHRIPLLHPSRTSLIPSPINTHGAPRALAASRFAGSGPPRHACPTRAQGYLSCDPPVRSSGISRCLWCSVHIFSKDFETKYYIQP